MMTRRTFLSSAISAGTIITAQGVRSSVAQPKRRIIVDSQVHQWLPESPERPWPPGRVAQLPYPFGPDKLVPMMDEAGVDRVVIVPPSWEGDRNDYALDAVQKYPGRFAVMGRIPIEKPESAALLPKWKEQPGMLGIRVNFNANPSWLMDGTVDWFWPAAEKAGIPVMFLGGKMSEYARIAERHPQLVLIIDHMGLSLAKAKAGKLAEAVTETVALAKFPNMSVKLSGAPGYSSQAYPFRDMAPHIQRCFEAFGPRRSFWGTDMTNSFAKATYRQRVTHFTEELPFLTEDDKDWVMGRGIMARLSWA